MYEVTSKLAADIHTEGFKNPLAWKRACMLINLLDPGDLGTKELSDMVKPTTDVDTTVRQVFQSRTNEVPNFPYTGNTNFTLRSVSKGLICQRASATIAWHGPYFVCEDTGLLPQATSGDLRGEGLPSEHMDIDSWQMGKRLKTELQSWNSKNRFDRWVERACFQYHPLNHVTPAPKAACHGSPARSRRGYPASQESIGNMGHDPARSRRGYPASPESIGAVKHCPARSRRGYPASQASIGSEKNT